ncbi:hypothetical protein R1flu_020613 [Riccia fluitans]|uniref:VWFA domain-containing protein n=1 Tax=Riccia fluitans TaxID=41844 RepID=A0ABD1ZM01_9MARC
MIGEILSRCNLPEGAFSVLPCSRNAADLFVTDERFKLVSFTGSPAIGWDMKARSGKKKVDVFLVLTLKMFYAAELLSWILKLDALSDTLHDGLLTILMKTRMLLSVLVQVVVLGFRSQACLMMSPWFQFGIQYKGATVRYKEKGLSQVEKYKKKAVLVILRMKVLKKQLQRNMSRWSMNIAEGLRKGTKVLEDRRMRNPVASIMLLSDGQYTYNMKHRSHGQFIPGGRRSALGSQIPVHTFGFGEDHDAALMHSIAEGSGGTFSFIQTESAVQDAFAQCIGGLLSVVVQNAQMKILAGDPGVQIRSIQAGTYQNSITDDRRQCIIKIGDLYAEEEKDVLVDRNRMQVAQSIVEAGALADAGEILPALAILSSAKESLRLSAAFEARDELFLALETELREIESRSKIIKHTEGPAELMFCQCKALTLNSVQQREDISVRIATVITTEPHR